MAVGCEACAASAGVGDVDVPPRTRTCSATSDKPEPAALARLVAGVASSPEPLEDVVAFVGRDAAAGVDDADRDRRRVDADGDRRRAACVAVGVLEEVADNAFHPPTVDTSVDRFGRIGGHRRSTELV